MSNYGNYQGKSSMESEDKRSPGYQGANRHQQGLPPSSSHVKDPRLLLLVSLVPGLVKAKHVLDIGCNAGAISVQLGLDFDAASVTGVDIDEGLIKRARSHLSFRCSRVRPGVLAPDVNYFPISAVMQYGHRTQCNDNGPIRTVVEPGFCEPVRQPASNAGLPISPDVVFVCEDWLSFRGGPHVKRSFDVIFALSVIKWIHLQHLDQGLISFFRKCAAYLHDGGHLVLETQSWKSYENAVKSNKSPHFEANFRRLQLRPDDFNRLLAEQRLVHILTSDKLTRRISVYRKEAS